MREHHHDLLDSISKKRPNLRVKHVNLFDFVLDTSTCSIRVDHLQGRKLLERPCEMQRDKGDEAVKKALAGPLHPEKLAPLFAEVARPDEHDLVLVSGVGSVYPLHADQQPAEQPPARSWEARRSCSSTPGGTTR